MLASDGLHGPAENAGVWWDGFAGPSGVDAALESAVRDGRDNITIALVDPRSLVAAH